MSGQNVDRARGGAGGWDSAQPSRLLLPRAGAGMRIGLLGAGRIGAFHAGTLAAHPDVTELLIAAGSASAHGVTGRGASGPGAAGQGVAGQVVSAVTVDRLFESRPDAVVIASATAAHAGLITRAARAGIPAFCEKPVAVDLAG